MCFSCPAGKHAEYRGQTHCKACAAGRFVAAQDDGAARCAACAAGRASPLVGATSAAVCLPCAAGLFALPGTPACETSCAAGTRSEGRAGCVHCPHGQFQPAAAKSYCVPCAPCDGAAVRRWCDGARGGRCVPCPRMTRFELREGHGKCVRCPGGQYSGKGATRCGKVTKQWLRTHATTAPKTAKPTAPPQWGFCPKGQWLKGASSVKKGGMPVFVAADSSKLHCVACPKGKFAGHAGTNVCTPCSKGRFRWHKGGAACKVCPKGKYQPLAGESFCYSRKAPTFRPAAPTPIPQQRPAAVPKFARPVPTPKATHPIVAEEVACKPGTFTQRNTIGALNCAPCPAGKYQYYMAMSSCEACPEGQHQFDTGRTACVTGAVSPDLAVAALSLGLPPATAAPTNTPTPVPTSPPTPAPTTSNDAQVLLDARKAAARLIQQAESTASPTPRPTTPAAGLQLPSAREFAHASTQAPTTLYPKAQAVMGCPPGKYIVVTSRELGVHQKCFRCAPGKFQRGSDRTGCEPCLAGLFQPLEGQDRCFEQGEKGIKQVEKAELKLEADLKVEHDKKEQKVTAARKAAAQAKARAEAAERAKALKERAARAALAAARAAARVAHTKEVATAPNAPSSSKRGARSRARSSKGGCPAGKFDGALANRRLHSAFFGGEAHVELKGPVPSERPKRQCIKCAAGQYKATSSLHPCLPCAPGMFQPLAGQTFCYNRRAPTNPAATSKAHRPSAVVPPPTKGGAPAAHAARVQAAEQKKLRELQELQKKLRLHKNIKMLQLQKQAQGLLQKLQAKKHLTLNQANAASVVRQTVSATKASLMLQLKDLQKKKARVRSTEKALAAKIVAQKRITMLAKRAAAHEQQLKANAQLLSAEAKAGALLQSAEARAASAARLAKETAANKAERERITSNDAQVLLDARKAAAQLIRQAESTGTGLGGLPTPRPVPTTTPVPTPQPSLPPTLAPTPGPTQLTPALIMQRAKLQAADIVAEAKAKQLVEDAKVEAHDMLRLAPLGDDGLAVPGAGDAGAVLSTKYQSTLSLVRRKDSMPTSCPAGKFMSQKAPPLAAATHTAVPASPTALHGKEKSMWAKFQAFLGASGGARRLSEASGCLWCPAGKFNPKPGSSRSCFLCPAGRYRPRCRQGSLCAADRCHRCPNGRWTALSQSPVRRFSVRACADQFCKAGSFLPQHATACLSCPLGKFSSSDHAPMCDSCPNGRSTTNRGSRACEVQPVLATTAAYSEGLKVLEGAAVAASEAREHTTDNEAEKLVRNALRNKLCPAGKFKKWTNPLPGQKLCYACPAGKYAAVVGSVMCLACGKTSSKTAIGATSRDCTRASATAATVGAPASVVRVGKVLNMAAGTAAPTSLKTPAPSPQASTAAPTASPTPKPTAKVSNCPAGRYRFIFQKQHYCMTCTPGRYSAASNHKSVCTRCPAGRFQPGLKSIACKACPSGQTSLPGATRCTDCPATGCQAAQSIPSTPKPTRDRGCTPGKYLRTTKATPRHFDHGSSFCVSCPPGKVRCSIPCPLNHCSLPHANPTETTLSWPRSFRRPGPKASARCARRARQRTATLPLHVSR